MAAQAFSALPSIPEIDVPPAALWTCGGGCCIALCCCFLIVLFQMVPLGLGLLWWAYRRSACWHFLDRVFDVVEHATAHPTSSPTELYVPEWVPGPSQLLSAFAPRLSQLAISYAGR